MIAPASHRILAIDPGNEWSAFVSIANGVVWSHGRYVNAYVLDVVEAATRLPLSQRPELAVEMIASYGMPVGREVFDTCVWIGRFIQAWGGPFRLVYRAEVKSHLCHSQRATDANVRAALIDKFGPGKAKAVGVKRAKGPLYGIKGDVWSALAVAVTAAETVAASSPLVEAARPGGDAR